MLAVAVQLTRPYRHDGSGRKNRFATLNYSLRTLTLNIGNIDIRFDKSLTMPVGSIIRQEVISVLPLVVSSSAATGSVLGMRLFEHRHPASRKKGCNTHKGRPRVSRTFLACKCFSASNLFL